MLYFPISYAFSLQHIKAFPYFLFQVQNIAVNSAENTFPTLRRIDVIL